MSKVRGGLVLILVLSLGLRLVLASKGGQQFWDDEDRYIGSQKAMTHFFAGEWPDVRRELLGHADHLLFQWLGLPCALVEHFTGPWPALAASYWGMFSVLTILMVWLLAKRLGAEDREALLAAALAACANSLFYHARHYFPYDAALALLLIAFWVGLDERGGWRFLLAGALTGLGFLTYNGYWLCGGAVLITLVLVDRQRRMAAAGLAGAGLFGVIGGAVVLGSLAGYDLVEDWQRITETITQGDFGLGWRTIGEYVWSAEGPLGIVWLLAFLVGMWWWTRTRDRAMAVWLLPVVIILTGLVVFSDVIQKFVVYGRLVKPLAPLLSLAAARVLFAGVNQGYGTRLLVPMAVTIALASALWNMPGQFRHEFPDAFQEKAYAETRRRMLSGYGVYRLVNVDHLWGADFKAPLPPHQVILRAAHPLQFRPYQYEGFSAAQRRDLAEHDISMRLIQLTSVPRVSGPESGLGRHIGPVRLKLRFPTNQIGLSEPLITTGMARRGDFLTVTYQDATHIRFGHDHWGRGGVLTEPIPIDYTKEHELIINMGSLYPTAWETGDPRIAWLEPLRSHLIVMLNGQTVLSTPAYFYPARPEEASISSNLIGGTSATAAFTGMISVVERYPLELMARHVPGARLAAFDRGRDWEGAPGPWRMKLDLTRMSVGEREPVYSAAIGQGFEAIVLQRIDAQSARLGLERWGEAMYWSDTFPAPPDKSHELLFSSGTQYPQVDSVFFRKHPLWHPLKRLAFASWNGQPVLMRNLEPLPGATVRAAAALRVDSRLTMPRHFSGTVLELDSVDPTDILRASTQLAAQMPSRGEGWLGYPGPVRLRVRLPQTLPENRVCEPLIVSGAPGAGDFLSLCYGPDGQVRFTFDHWGSSGPPASEPINWRPGSEHEVVVHAGFLLPPPGASLYQEEPMWEALRRRVMVLVDGQQLLDAVVDSHPTSPEQITLGTNFIGGSTAASAFSGAIAVVGHASPPKPGH